MKIQICSLLLNESEWLLKNYQQHKDWPGLVSWVFVHGADVTYGEANPDVVTSEGLSVDGTKDILDEIARTDERVTVIHHGWMSHPDRAQAKCVGRNRYLEVAGKIRPDFLIIADLDEFYTRENQSRINLLMQDRYNRPFNGLVFKQRHLWYPPMSFYNGLTNIFSREVIGGYWAIPHCRVWRYLPGMRYTNNHNTPEDHRGISFKPYLKRYDKLPPPPFGDWPQCIHMGYASSSGVRMAKHRYYEARGEGQGDGRQSYINCRRAWEVWQEGFPLPHGARVVAYDGPIPECFQVQSCQPLHQK